MKLKWWIAIILIIQKVKVIIEKLVNIATVTNTKLINIKRLHWDEPKLQPTKNLNLLWNGPLTLLTHSSMLIFTESATKRRIN